MVRLLVLVLAGSHGSGSHARVSSRTGAGWSMRLMRSRGHHGRTHAVGLWLLRRHMGHLRRLLVVLLLLVGLVSHHHCCSAGEESVHTMWCRRAGCMAARSVQGGRCGAGPAFICDTDGPLTRWVSDSWEKEPLREVTGRAEVVRMSSSFSVAWKSAMHLRW
jgi:hypothetical protein